MAETNNSFSTILAEFVRLQNNALEIISKQSQAVTTDADVISVKTTNADGTSTTYTIPSFSGIKSAITRIDSTLNTLMGFDAADSYVRMPDGSFKRIYQTKTPVDPPRIGTVTVPAKFIAENNWFFESLLSPALKVSFDVTRYIPQDESKIGVKRLIINTDTSDKKSYFDNNIKGRNDIDYVAFLVELQKANLTYFVDEEVMDLPLSVVRYSGAFTVVSYQDQKVTLQDGTEVTKRRYLFNTLQYNDNLSVQANTMTLKVGDQLIKGETIYEVNEVNIENRYVGVKRLRGYEPLVAGEPVNIYSSVFSPKLANVGIGFDERQVIFFKNVNDEANLISTKWSPGVSFYSNDLTIELAEGTTTLADFYQTRVMDFGSQLIAGSKNGVISVLDGITPDAPILDGANFKVVQINDHKLDQDQVVAIRKKAADKVRLESLIDKLEASIDKKKEQLNTTNFSSETERRGVKNELDSLIREKNSQSSLYASIVNELAAISKDAPAALDAPKYRVRGFFDIPTPKYSDKTGFQNVIQFYVYYRYVNPAGNAGNVKQFDFSSQSGETRRATFSNLVQVKSEIRTKSYDVTTGKYVWDNEDIENPDAVNINQVDIPISKGEKVEFYVVAASEAGWPATPLLSPASNLVTVEFPQDLVDQDEATIALAQARQEEVRVQLESDLAAKGLDIHLSSSFNAGEQYYAHSADVISSSFYNSSGVVISLYEKLKAMDIAIQEIQNSIASAKGELRVYIIDKDNSTKTEVQTGSTVKLFAGYYVDYVNLLPASSQRGAIINKVYILSLENPIAATLELVSEYPGGLAEDLPVSVPLAGTTYDKSLRYDITPIVNTSIANDDTNNSNKLASAFYQSGQLKSQFLYSRHTDIGLAKRIYEQPTILADRILEPILPPVTSPTTYVWNGTWTGLVPNGNGQLTNFAIHTQHPAINSTVAVTYAQLQTPTITNVTVDGKPLAPESTSAFRHSLYFNDGSAPYQLQYQNNWAVNAPAVITAPYVPSMDELPDKFGFIDNDRYLIGKNTCGNYLYVAPATFDQLLVDGTDYRAVKNLGTGENNAIQIPIIYQFRMTDYAGDNTGTGTGYVGGYDSTVGWTPPTQLNYQKRVGIDIYVKNTTMFSFDIIVNSTYKRESLAQRVDEIQTSLVKVRENITYDKTTIKTLNS
jgi:hypothetical protein